MAAQLQRLVCGELDEAQRRPLLDWLDQEPGRWRLCGLLFFEAQTWSEAIKEWPAQHTSEPQGKSTLTRSNLTARGGLRRVRDALVLAASVLVAYVLGAATQIDEVYTGAPSSVVKGTSNANDTHAVVGTSSKIAPIMARLPATKTAGLPVQPALHIPVVPGSRSVVSNGDDGEAIPDYVRQQWARRGYRLDLERRFLLATLPDGQRVAVPFEQYSIKPIPPRIN
jgi:hypothetical protein